MITCNAQVEFKLSTDAKNPEQIIELADSLSQNRWNERMDSLDLGDSMGVFIRAATEDLYNGDLDSIYMGDGFWVRVDMGFERFNWEGVD